MGTNHCLICGDIANEPQSSGIAQLYGAEMLAKSCLWESDTLRATPAPGTITVGYLILTPKQHLLNFAQADRELLAQCASFFAHVSDVGQANRLYSYIAFEHGAADPFDHGAACVEHAHMHLVPAPEPEHIRKDLSSRYREARIDSLEQLRDQAAHFPYVLLHVANAIYVYQTPEIPKQIVRRYLAAQWSVAEQWDWVQHPFEENFVKTINMFAGRLGPLSSFGQSERAAC